MPVPGVYGVPEQWPHVYALLERVGFVRGDRTEFVYLADADRLPRANPVPELGIVRTLGAAGTRFTARTDAVDVGYIEADLGVGGTGWITSGDGWADVGPAGPPCPPAARLLAYATPDEVEHRALLEPTASSSSPGRTASGPCPPER